MMKGKRGRKRRGKGGKGNITGILASVWGMDGDMSSKFCRKWDYAKAITRHIER